MLHRLALSELVSFTLPHSVLGMGRDFHTFSAGKVPGRIKPQIVENRVPAPARLSAAQTNSDLWYPPPSATACLSHTPAPPAAGGGAGGKEVRLFTLYDAYAGRDKRSLIECLKPYENAHQHESMPRHHSVRKTRNPKPSPVRERAQCLSLGLGLAIAILWAVPAL